MPYQGNDPMPERSGGAGAPAGLSWSWEMDAGAPAPPLRSGIGSFPW
jgi:hypothetical protein